jgi:hypothetical protein
MRAALWLMLFSPIPLIAQTSADEPYNGGNLRFTVLLIGSPKIETKTLQYGPNVEQVIRTTLTHWEIPQRGGMASVSVSFYPESFKDIDPKKILDGVRDGLRGPESLGGKIESEKEITLGEAKLPGREVIIKAKKNWVRARLFLIEQSLYQVTVTGSEDNVKGKTATQFLDSFRHVK